MYLLGFVRLGRSCRELHEYVRICKSLQGSAVIGAECTGRSLFFLFLCCVLVYATSFIVVRSNFITRELDTREVV